MQTHSLIAISVFCAVMAPGVSASTIPCVSGPVSTLAHTTCSIGNLVYTFGNASVRNDGGIAGLSTSSITLTPDAFHNGFTLSGTISDTGPANSVFEDELDLAAIFSVINGDASATGVTSGFTGSATGNGYTAFTEFNQSDANDGPNINFAYAQPAISGLGGCDAGAGITGTFSCSVSFDRGPVSATDFDAGQVVYGIVASRGGTATITSAEYFVDGVPAGSPGGTPEPASVGLALLGLGLLLSRGLLQKKRSATGIAQVSGAGTGL